MVSKPPKVKSISIRDNHRGTGACDHLVVGNAWEGKGRYPNVVKTQRLRRGEWCATNIIGQVDVKII